MSSPKPEKIDLHGDYPCPCRRRGNLVPITLTEAFGCDRCQQIFVVDETGYSLEQLATHYPYKQAWRWTGQQWYRATPGMRSHYLPLALGILLVPLVIWLPLAMYSPGANILLWAMVAVMLAMLPALMVWLAYRR
ncbi:MAG: hypothetical protein EA414_16415 [Arthrospira sp. PLM2.Bin9]|nr:hypothetical protein [Arthrospira sp. PLM2.Bin9]TVU52656.1 MAG: hypothetical protein EA414_16415 [Arthrospira sp. PLM2.Bin9]